MGSIVRYRQVAEQIGESERTEGTLVARGVVITSERRDRYGDIVRMAGALLDDYKHNPVVLLSHGASSAAFPVVGSGENIKATNSRAGLPALQMDIKFARTQLAREIASLWEDGHVRATSISFKPDAKKFVRVIGPDGAHIAGADPEDYERDMPEGYGFEFLRWHMLEDSIVPVPANPEALGRECEWSRDAVTRMRTLPEVCRAFGLAHRRSFIAPSFGRATFHRVECSVTDCLGCGEDHAAAPASTETAPAAEPVRWNRQLPEEFDVAELPLEPAGTALDMAAKFCRARACEMFESGTAIMSVRMGSFLTALGELLEDRGLLCVATRNPEGGEYESPPLYKTVQLNSQTSRRFLVRGTRFYRREDGSGARIVLRFDPAWYGLRMEALAREVDADEVEDIVSTAWRMAKTTHNFLRGESFTMGGEFLAPTAEGWGDIFLAPGNAEALRRTAEAVNQDGAKAESRGIMMLGDPGNGKTLACRILRNEVKGTFIWVSTRDIYYGGSFGSIAEAFEMARELAPTVLCLDDADDSISGETFMLLKTEMDGVERSSGVVTCLTTNHPERLPDALLDRPGRFHDVLKFGFPDVETRGRMVESWIPGLAADLAASVVERTDGYSGAYVRELASYAASISRQDRIGMPDAVERALAKIEEQRRVVAEAGVGSGRGASRRAWPTLAGPPGVRWSRSFRDSKALPAPGEQAVADEGEPRAGADIRSTLTETSVEECPRCSQPAPYHRASGRFIGHETPGGGRCASRGAVVARPRGITLWQIASSFGSRGSEAREEVLASGAVSLSLHEAASQARTRAAAVAGAVERAGAVLSRANRTVIEDSVAAIAAAESSLSRSRAALEAVLAAAAPKQQAPPGPEPASGGDGSGDGVERAIVGAAAMAASTVIARLQERNR